MEKSRLRAVTVMNIEVDDRDALQLVYFASVSRGDRSLIEDTKTHCPRRLGMMTAWTRRAERVARLPVHYRIDAGTRRANAAHDGFPGTWRHHRVAGIERHITSLRGNLLDLVDERRVVDQLHLLECAQRRLAPFQRREFRRPQCAQHGLQTFRRLRMTGTWAMIQTRCMGKNKGSRHLD
ncbi:UNVERIFIED_ORG: hypothetical protein ABIC62_002060 [Burkholderia sp. 1595]|uniref:Uncharacterized protein n=1 Tax=Paraburkholderia terricola TaxID=169427 RepID=A0ABU1LPK6_9BURK|nr:hypothetical protein [Paraburkholderia terricola]